MSTINKYTIYIVLTVIHIAASSRILGVVSSPSYSHQAVFRPIWRELARRGHDLVVLTADPEHDPNLNITEIDIGSVHELLNTKYNASNRVSNSFKYNPFKTISFYQQMVLDLCISELQELKVQALVKNETEHFDLVIVEYLYPIMFAFAARFNCPYIGVTTVDLPDYFHKQLGNPTHTVLYPDILLPFESNLNFWERLISMLFNVAMDICLITTRYSNEMMSVIVKEQFGRDLPPLDDIMRNVSMVLMNVNPIFNTRPLGPAFIPIGGGIHLNKAKPLPKGLQDFLDGAENGAIYFSLGTNVKSDTFSPELRKVMVDAFKELPYRVLWKFDITDVPDVPENVKIVDWLPQQDILRHPNVKLFISQGGLQSMEEAIFSNVPLVSIPFVGDQDANVKKMVRKGFGVGLDKNTLAKEPLKEAILEVINNPKYKQKITAIADLSRDQPMTGLEKAVWWTEFVLRHKGAPHLRSPAIDLPLYQYYLLDVLGFFVVTILIFLYVIYKLVAFINRLIICIFSSNRKIKEV